MSRWWTVQYHDVEGMLRGLGRGPTAEAAEADARRELDAYKWAMRAAGRHDLADGFFFESKVCEPI